MGRLKFLNSWTVCRRLKRFVGIFFVFCGIFLSENMKCIPLKEKEKRGEVRNGVS